METNEGSILREFVRKSGKSQEEFAATLDMTRQNLNNYFLKKALPYDFKKKLGDSGYLLFANELASNNGSQKRGKPYLSDIDAFAGKVDIVNEDIKEYITGYIYIPEFNKADLYINVRGHSMYPRYAAGEIISLRKVQDMDEIQFGQVYVVVTDENRVIKYVRKGSDDKHFKLVSENPKFDDYEVDRKKVRAMFLVLGKITKDVL